MPPTPKTIETPHARGQDALGFYATRDPHRLAVSFPLAGQTITFGKWHHDAEALARVLLSRGLGNAAHIALLAESRIEWPIVAMAIAMAGSVLVPLNTHYRLDDLRYALAQSKSRALFLSPQFRNNAYRDMVDALRAELPQLEQCVLLSDEASAGPRPGYESLDNLIAAGRTMTQPLPNVSPDAFAMLLYSSGTTGQPKGALITHRAAMQNAWVAGNRLGLDEHDRLTTMVPLFHCAGVIGAILNALVHGAAYVGVPIFEPEAMFRVIEAERCTWLTAVPTAFAAMLQHPARGRYDLTSLRVGTCGGADVPPALIERCATEFPIPGLVQVYGQTEGTCFTSLCTADDALRYRTAGRPLEGLEARITDPQTRAVLPTGEIGEIELRGATLMSGYFERAAETRETMDAEGWLRTGDLGRLHASGHIELAGGRLKDMIIRGGENVYAVEVENVLLQHPDVAAVAVFGLPDAYYGEIVAAAIRPRGEAPAIDELIRFCQARIARYKAPTKLFCVEHFPLTASGKIQKRALRELAVSGALALYKEIAGDRKA